MADDQRHAGNLKRVGGLLCLDYANTVDWRTGDQPYDWFVRYDDLVAWSRHAGILDEQTDRALLKKAAQTPTVASSVLEEAVELREAVFQIFFALASGRSPKTSDIAALNRFLTDSFSRIEIVLKKAEFVWKWSGAKHALEQMLWPVARSAADFLTSGDLGRIRICAGEGCGWLFIDTSKNRRRRWCAMEDCGNREKARRYYQKRRTEDAG
jgi:predicted RNA-binding Zn ribbon-like protein